MITNNVKVIRRIQEDPELSAFAETQAAIWQDAIKEAVLEERERCAVVSESHLCRCAGSLACTDCEDVRRAVADEIRLGNDRGCDPPQTEKGVVNGER